MEEKDIAQQEAVDTKKSKIKKFFSDKNIWIRVISFLCALLLWFYVSEVESPTSEKSFEEITVNVKNKDVLLNETELSLISDALYEVEVVLSGKKSTLNKVDYENIAATIDLARLKEAGVHELPVSVVPPAGTSVVSVNPKYITVSIDKTVATSFDIEVDPRYTLPSNYTLGDCIVYDSQSKAITSVTVSGPATETAKIDKVVAKVDFGTISGSVEATAELILKDYYGETISTESLKLSTKSVKVKLPVYTTKTLPLSASQANGTFANTQISFNITPARVEVMGDPKILEEMNTLPLDPINERAIGETMSTTVTTLIKLPEGLELVTAQNTATITAKLKNVKCQEIDVTSKDIDVVELPEDMEIEFHNVDSHIIVMNSSTKELTINDLLLSLDLSTYSTSGLYTVFLTPTFKKETSWAYLPYPNYSVTFELTDKEVEKD